MIAVVTSSKAQVTSVMLYNCNSWAATQKELHKLDVPNKKTKIPIKIKDIPGKTLRHSRKTTKIPIRLESFNHQIRSDQTWLKSYKEATKPNSANINNTQKNLFNFSKDYYNSRTKERVKLRAHKTVKIQSTKTK